jgi:hypothetical protein
LFPLKTFKKKIDAGGKIKMKRMCYTFLMFIFIISSCDYFSDDLTRSKAKKILSAQKEYLTMLIPAINTWRGSWGDYDNIDKLAKNGYVTLSVVPNGIVLNVERYDITINDTLKPFIVGYKDSLMGEKNFFADVKLADVVFDDITGITTHPMSPNVKIVEYRVKIVPSEMSRLFPIAQYSNPQINKEAIFQKFDDGWRLER